MARYDHVCCLAFTIASDKEDGSDITRGQFLQAIQRRITDLVDDWAVHEAILPPEDTYVQEMTQEEFRENPEQCVVCHCDSISGGLWDCEGDFVYQVRTCNNCEESWTVAFKAQHFNKHNE
jgi:hypothetical protein